MRIVGKKSVSGLNYSDTTKKGYTRHKSGTKFIYRNTRGEQIRDEIKLKRISSLVIPPAWTDVWICTDKKGHIQCYGYDDRMRKQYIYHADWSEQRNIKKFKKINDLGLAMAGLQKKISADLKHPTWTKEKTCAVGLSLVKETLMRVGNIRYTKANKSYGLTTLRKKHLAFDEGTVWISYVGKKGVTQEHHVSDAILTNYLRELYELPGHTLFKYYRDEQPHSAAQLLPKDINSYLKDCCGRYQVTAKSFRIWGASLLALGWMIRVEKDYELSKAKARLNEVLDHVAEMLGNTRAVTKKYYVHPVLQDLFVKGKLYKRIRKVSTNKRITKREIERIFQKVV